MKKLKSRKFLLTLLTNIIAIANLFVNSGETTLEIISIIVVLISNTLYSLVEGNIDAKAVLKEVEDATKKIEEKM